MAWSSKWIFSLGFEKSKGTSNNHNWDKAQN